MRETGKAEIKIVSDIPYDQAIMADALHKAARTSQGVIFVGGQGNLVMPHLALNFPDQSFAVVQGSVIGPNLASYDVLQEQSAFLAGVAAARLTRTGIVGHLSGHRVAPGLKGRAAFAAGVRYIDKRIDLITGFCGSQDDNAVAQRWSAAIANAGADILFTMLNAARSGVIDTCRAIGMRQIGNAADWCAVDPAVFVASAVARIDLGVDRAVIDLLAGRSPDQIEHLDLGQGAVELTCAPDVPSAVVEEIKAKATLISRGQLHVDTTYEGPEFELGR